MRCYNGCPDSELKAIWDELDALDKKLKQLNPHAHCTYHHPTGTNQHGFVVHEWGKEISSFHQSARAALVDAIAVLEKQPQVLLRS